MMTKKYELVLNYIKDLSVEVPDSESFIISREQISKYVMGININSKALKNKMIEVITKLEYKDPGHSKKKSYFEILYASVIKVKEENLDKKDIPNDLRWGVYIVIKAQNDYVKNCFKDYGMVTDSSGSYSAIWRPYHYIGLELAQSIYSIVLDNKATGYTKNYNAEIASIAKKDLKAGQKLDGEGGYCARGRLISSAKSKRERILPMGYTDNAILKKDIMKDQFITLDDVELNLQEEIIKAREYQYNL